MKIIFLKEVPLVVPGKMPQSSKCLIACLLNLFQVPFESTLDSAKYDHMTKLSYDQHPLANTFHFRFKLLDGNSRNPDMLHYPTPGHLGSSIVPAMELFLTPGSRSDLILPDVRYQACVLTRWYHE